MFYLGLPPFNMSKELPFVGFIKPSKYLITYRTNINNNVPKNSFTKGFFNKSFNVNVEVTLEDILSGKDINAESSTPGGKNKIINIHPALLPKYGGKGMYGKHVHQAVLDNQETETGITIHYVNEQYDEGGIIFQKSVSIQDCSTFEEVSKKVHQLEHVYFPEVIDQLL
jgi:phosphoribosylglycinamide formyltransferase-1